MTNLLDGLRVPLYGDGLNVRDWLHVDDHCRGIQLVAEKGRPGEVYNIGGGTELTNRELTYRLLDAVGADESMIEPVADRQGARPAVLGGLVEDRRRAGVRAAGAVRRGAGGDGGVVPAATATGGSRSRPERSRGEGLRAADRRRVGVRAHGLPGSARGCSPRRSRVRRSGRRWGST